MASNGAGRGTVSQPVSGGPRPPAISPSTSVPPRSLHQSYSYSPGQQTTAVMTTGGGAVQLVQLTAQAKLLQPELVSVMKKVQEIERNFDQRENQLRTKEAAMREEHHQAQEELQQWKTEEEGKLLDEHRRLELEKEAFKQRMTWERDRLKKDKQDFEHRCSEGGNIAHRQEPVTLEVGGEKFRTELSTLTKCKESLFPDLVKALERRQESDRDGRQKRDPHIFIDRDGRHFRFILNYLRQGEQVMRGAALKKADKDDLKDILFEVRYYRLTDLERLVERKMVALQRPIDFKQLVEGAHCFRKFDTATSTKSPQAAQDARRYKYITAKDIFLKGENLKGIVFDHVVFEHGVAFQDCVLTEAKFIQCAFRGAVNLQNADLFRAKFDHCDGIDFSARFYMEKANTNEVQFVPPLVGEDS